LAFHLDQGSHPNGEKRAKLDGDPRSFDTNYRKVIPGMYVFCEEQGQI